MSGGDENVFDCAICTEAFSDPRILRCFHTFCRNCLQQLADKSSHKKSFDCPLCRETYVLPANGVDGIQKNFYLSSTPAPKKARLPFCKEHTEEDLRFYCYKCKRAICRDCKVLSQLGHQIDLISNVAAEYRIKLDDLINQTDVCVEYFENYHNDISKRSTVAIGLISQMASTCKREIDILQDRLTSEVKLDSNHKGFRQILKDIKDKIHRLRHKKESLLAYKDTRKVDDFIKAYDDLVEEKTISLDNSSYKAACLDDEKEAFAEKEALLMFENVSQAIQSEVKSCNVKR